MLNKQADPTANAFICICYVQFVMNTRRLLHHEFLEKLYNIFSSLAFG